MDHAPEDHLTITAPPTISWLTRWEFDGAGVHFKVWTRPVVSDGGAQITPMMLLWQFENGNRGKRAVDGLVDATSYAATVVSAASNGKLLTS
jgi:hypothetical protein